MAGLNLFLYSGTKLFSDIASSVRIRRHAFVVSNSPEQPALIQPKDTKQRRAGFQIRKLVLDDFLNSI